MLTAPAFVVRDNIDTDQIIPAEYLTLVPTIPPEYEKLGSYAMAGLPPALYPVPFIEPGTMKTRFPIIIGGRNFGCGSSREHAPIALGAAGVKAVIAESYARIFFRNSVATGELYPFETPERLLDLVQTGDVVSLDLEAETLQIGARVIRLKSLGEARPVIAAGGLFNFARQSGMIAAAGA